MFAKHDKYNLYKVRHAETLNMILNIKKPSDNSLIAPRTLLCKGKLVKAWGLGGLFKSHSKELYTIFKIT